MSVPRNHTAGGVIEGKFYVVGGRASDFSGSTDALEVYDPQTDLWSTRPPMPTARSGLAAAVVDNELWVFGGADVLDFVVHGVVGVYNPAMNLLSKFLHMSWWRQRIWLS